MSVYTPFGHLKFYPIESIELYFAVTNAETAFIGTGLSTAAFVGTFTGEEDTNYIVEIDGNSTIDTFRWSMDGGSTWEDAYIDITGDAQELSDGISIDFAAITGYTIGDQWVFNPLGRKDKIIHCDRDASYRLSPVTSKGQTVAWKLEVNIPLLQNDIANMTNLLRKLESEEMKNVKLNLKADTNYAGSYSGDMSINNNLGILLEKYFCNFSIESSEDAPRLQLNIKGLFSKIFDTTNIFINN